MHAHRRPRPALPRRARPPAWATAARPAVAHGRVLTLGDAEGLAAAGGMVERGAVRDARRFDLNLAVVRAAPVVPSALALKLARQPRE